MDKLCFSIDEERYDDRHGHVLSLVGWYMHPDKKECGFQLIGDGYEVIDIPEVERYDRPDVAQSLEVETEGFFPGFTVTIPEVLKLRQKYDILELLLLDGEEKTVIWEHTGDELDELIKDKLVEFHIDRVEVLYGLMLEIQGWTTDQRGEVEVTVHKENAELLDCKITRGRRPDVVERRHLDDDYRNQEIGFSISAAFLEIPGNRIVLHFCGDSTTKTYEIDIKALRREQKEKEKAKGFWGRLFHKDKNGEHKEDYEEWFERHKADRKTLRRQRHEHFEQNPLISIVIPLYCTPTPYLKELIDSVRSQTYTNWQLCLADGSPDQKVEEYVQKRYGKDKRILYKHLEGNGGISVNTNKAIEMATGEYLMLSDHDDTLEPDALYEIVRAINDHQGPEIIYTDEDKLSMDGEFYFEPHFKSDYNLFRLRDNNYICHIFVVKKALVNQVGGLRPEFDGSQDYDFILRCCEQAKQVIHIPKVLYHWRCHEASTAANPHSKKYAYEAGLRALQDHAAERGIPAKAEETRHVGFYRLQYTEVLQERPDVAAVGGRVLSGKNRGRIAGGRMTADGKVFYEGLPKDFGGYLHRAELSQDAEALDLRCIRIRSADRELFEKIVGVPYTEVVRGPEQQPVFDSSTLPAGADIRLLSLQLSEALRKRGRLLYLPEYPEKWERL